MNFKFYLNFFVEVKVAGEKSMQSKRFLYKRKVRSEFYYSFIVSIKV